jgi:hypothetical protein
MPTKALIASCLPSKKFPYRFPTLTLKKWCLILFRGWMHYVCTFWHVRFRCQNASHGLTSPLSELFTDIAVILAAFSSSALFTWLRHDVPTVHPPGNRRLYI